MKKPDSKSLLFIAIGFILPMLAARAARTAVGGGYKLITHNDPPKNPANPDVAWKDALIWAAISGVGRWYAAYPPVVGSPTPSSRQKAMIWMKRSTISHN